MSDFDETLLDMLGELEANGVDFSGDEMAVSLIVNERPDIVFTISMEKKEEYEANLESLH